MCLGDTVNRSVQEWIALSGVVRLATRNKTFTVVVEGWLIELLRRKAHVELRSGESVRQWLHLGSSTRNDFAFLDLQQPATRDLSDVLVVLFAVFLVLFIYVEQQFLQLVAGKLILIVKARAHAKMKGLFRLFLPWTLLEAGPLASETQLDNVLRVHVSGAVLNDAFHVASLRADQPTSHLEFFVVRNLDVKPTSVLYRLIVQISTVVISVHLLRHLKWLRSPRVENVLVDEHALRHRLGLSWLAGFLRNIDCSLWFWLGLAVKS